MTVVDERRMDVSPEDKDVRNTLDMFYFPLRDHGGDPALSAGSLCSGQNPNVEGTTSMPPVGVTSADPKQLIDRQGLPHDPVGLTSTSGQGHSKEQEYWTFQTLDPAAIKFPGGRRLRNGDVLRVRLANSGRTRKLMFRVNSGCLIGELPITCDPHYPVFLVIRAYRGEEEVSVIDDIALTLWLSGKQTGEPPRGELATFMRFMPQPTTTTTTTTTTTPPPHINGQLDSAVAVVRQVDMDAGTRADLPHYPPLDIDGDVADMSDTGQTPYLFDDVEPVGMDRETLSLPDLRVQRSDSDTSQDVQGSLVQPPPGLEAIGGRDGAASTLLCANGVLERPGREGLKTGVLLDLRPERARFSLDDSGFLDHGSPQRRISETEEGFCSSSSDLFSTPPEYGPIGFAADAEVERGPTSFSEMMKERFGRGGRDAKERARNRGDGASGANAGHSDSWAYMDAERQPSAQAQGSSGGGSGRGGTWWCDRDSMNRFEKSQSSGTVCARFRPPNEQEEELQRKARLTRQLHMLKRGDLEQLRHPTEMRSLLPRSGKRPDSMMINGRREGIMHFDRAAWGIPSSVQEDIDLTPTPTEVEEYSARVRYAARRTNEIRDQTLAQLRSDRLTSQEQRPGQTKTRANGAPGGGVRTSASAQDLPSTTGQGLEGRGRGRGNSATRRPVRASETRPEASARRGFDTPPATNIQNVETRDGDSGRRAGGTPVERRVEMGRPPRVGLAEMVSPPDEFGEREYETCGEGRRHVQTPTLTRSNGSGSGRRSDGFGRVTPQPPPTPPRQETRGLALSNIQYSESGRAVGSGNSPWPMVPTPGSVHSGTPHNCSDTNQASGNTGSQSTAAVNQAQGGHAHLLQPTRQAGCECGWPCMVCMEEPIEMCLYPCGCVCFCEGCFLNYKSRKDTERAGDPRKKMQCIVCRVDIQGAMKIRYKGYAPTSSLTT